MYCPQLWGSKATRPTDVGWMSSLHKVAMYHAVIRSINLEFSSPATLCMFDPNAVQVPTRHGFMGTKAFELANQGLREHITKSAFRDSKVPHPIRQFPLQIVTGGFGGIGSLLALSIREKGGAVLRQGRRIIRTQRYQFCTGTELMYMGSTDRRSDLDGLEHFIKMHHFRSSGFHHAAGILKVRNVPLHHFWSA